MASRHGAPARARDCCTGGWAGWPAALDGGQGDPAVTTPEKTTARRSEDYGATGPHRRRRGKKASAARAPGGRRWWRLSPTLGAPASPSNGKTEWAAVRQGDATAGEGGHGPTSSARGFGGASGAGERLLRGKREEWRERRHGKATARGAALTGRRATAASRLLRQQHRRLLGDLRGGERRRETAAGGAIELRRRRRTYSAWSAGGFGQGRCRRRQFITAQGRGVQTAPPQSANGGGTCGDLEGDRWAPFQQQNPNL
jgi:hypothetical protein